MALAWVAFTVVAVGIYQTSSGCYQGLGKVYVPMSSLALGVVIKIAFNVCADVCVGARNPRSGDRYSGRFWLCGFVQCVDGEQIYRCGLVQRETAFAKTCYFGLR